MIIFSTEIRYACVYIYWVGGRGGYGCVVAAAGRPICLLPRICQYLGTFIRLKSSQSDYTNASTYTYMHKYIYKYILMCIYEDLLQNIV